MQTWEWQDFPGSWWSSFLPLLLLVIGWEIILCVWEFRRNIGDWLKRIIKNKVV